MGIPIKTLLSGLVFIIFSLFSDVSLAQDVPEDFEISLYSAPVMPGALPGPMGVVIDSDGTATITKQTDSGEETTKTVTLFDGAPAALWGVIEDFGFFNLDPEYVNPNVLDGDYAIIRVTANGETHEVKTTNIRLAPFDAIALWINSNFSPDDMILYNAFLDHDMMEAGS